MTNREMPKMPSLEKSEEAKQPEVEMQEQPKMEAPKPSKGGGIEVMAASAGFYKRYRRKTGDRFVVAKFEDLASWMKCVDPVLQKKHAENQKKRKQVLRAHASGGVFSPLADLTKKPAGE